jgi:hypothetical protein
MIDEVALLRTHPNSGEQFRVALQTSLKIVNDDPAFGGASLRADIDDPDQFLLTLTWTSKEAQQAVQAHQQRWVAFVGPLMQWLTAKPDLRFISREDLLATESDT